MKRILLLFCLSAAAGCFGLVRLLAGDFPVAAAGHAASAALGGWAAVLSDNRRLGRHVFQAALACSLPFFGGMTACVLSEAVKRKQTGSLADEFAVYLNDAASFRESVPVGDMEAPPQEHLAPLYDILAGNATEAEQRIAVENLVSMETPAAMDILRRVVETNKGEGRFFAMTALGQMEEKLLARLQRQEEAIASGRDAGVRPLLEAAGTYIDFVYYRIAQDARRFDYLRRAAELLEAALEKEDCPDSVLLTLGRAHLLSYDGDAALARFNDYLALYPGNAVGLIWRAEAWHLLGDFSRVQDDCRAARRQGDIPAGIRSSVLFWLGDGEEEEDDGAAAVEAVEAGEADASAPAGGGGRMPA